MLFEIQKAREKFTSWFDISKSDGWKAYEERVNKKIEIIKNQMDNDTDLNGEDLKKLQLALQVWKQVQRIPKELEDNAKGGK
jgi:ATP-dependent protease ClpP protease subunit